ncbi:MAG: nuclear mRNA export, poly(A)+RNA binding protein [Pycnora praestabilis]|nr:MAG: nuclear mRNA export, poly(A)+RNA binding protein [Pycnora praestabilis]
MLQTPPSSGPRGGRGGSRNTSNNRGPPRGGIQKRKGGPLRVDLDGDLDMEAEKGAGRGRGNPPRRSQRNSDSTPVFGREASRNASGRRNNDGAAMQNAITRAMTSGEANIKGAKAGLEIAGVLNEASGKGKGRGRGGALDQISVRGWKESKAASNPGGGIKDLVAFLQRKTIKPDMPAREAVRIRKSRSEGDALIISVIPEDTEKILKLNTYQFAGAPLTIELLSGENHANEANTESQGATTTKQIMTNVLSRRYNSETKLLDLSALGKDSELINIGMFKEASTESKFFPALMKVCDLLFESAQHKREAIVSVTLANNELPNITNITSLSQTFPDLRNLDLSNNNFKDLRAIEGWRLKFRQLEYLIITGNPLENNVPNYNDELLKWYPTLRFLNNVQVRSDKEIAAIATSRDNAAKGKLPIPVQPASFHDEGQIAENFVKHFFSNYDNDRMALASGYYNEQSTFSLSVNTNVPRGTQQQAVGEMTKPQSWDAYIKKSRNMKKINHLSARMSRAYVGPQNIGDCWITLPSTRHPDLLGEPQKWLIECNSMPGLPDPTGQSAGGVGGLIVYVHGEFEEINVATGQGVTKRSFDRNFVLGPGGGIGGLRVISDILMLRAWGGSEAWVPDSVRSIPAAAPTPTPAIQIQQQPDSTAAFGLAAPDKTEDQLQKEAMIVDLGRRTNMTVAYTTLCMEESGWNFEGALVAFENVKGSLPADAFN